MLTTARSAPPEPVADALADALARAVGGASTVGVANSKQLRRALRTSSSGPLLAVGPRCRSSPDGDVVLVALDGSAAAEGALEVGARVADALDLDLSLLLVARPRPPRQVDADRVRPDQLEANYLARRAALLPRRSRPVTWEVLHGEPAAAIAAHARHRRAALVVLNTLDGGTPPKATCSRVTAGVVVHSPAPVLLTRVTVPPPDDRYRARARRVRTGLMAAAALAVVGLATAAAVAPGPRSSTAGAARPADDFVRLARSVDQRPSSILVTTVEPPRYPEDSHAALAARVLMEASATTARSVARQRAGTDAAGPLSVDTHDLGGPSAGLAFALEIYDRLTRGPLTGGRTVAATGSLGADGHVEPVGGAGDKATAARRAGADAILVPPANRHEAAAGAPGFRVVAVASFDEALAALRSL